MPGRPVSPGAHHDRGFCGACPLRIRSVGALFIDYLGTSRGTTATGAYSARARHWLS